jgi:hypothetical protein
MNEEEQKALWGIITGLQETLSIVIDVNTKLLSRIENLEGGLMSVSQENIALYDKITTIENS